jgi:hypothetical protein
MKSLGLGCISVSVNVLLQDDTESLPFPNDEREFSLPEADFASMMEEKLKQEKKKDL